MHTTKIKGTKFHHNGDMSGDVTIVQEREDGHITEQTVKIPFEVLEQFVIENSIKVQSWKEDSNAYSWIGINDMNG